MRVGKINGNEYDSSKFSESQRHLMTPELTHTIIEAQIKFTFRRK